MPVAPAPAGLGWAVSPRGGGREGGGDGESERGGKVKTVTRQTPPSQTSGVKALCFIGINWMTVTRVQTHSEQNITCGYVCQFGVTDERLWKTIVSSGVYLLWQLPLASYTMHGNTVLQYYPQCTGADPVSTPPPGSLTSTLFILLFSGCLGPFMN